jgi:DNA-binding transcriptional ArsR family regulator
MEMDRTIVVLDALAQRTRLDVIELLLQHEPMGLSSGDVARALNIPQNTMSAHLSKLNQAGLVRAERQSRFVIYHANRNLLIESLSALVDHYRAVSKRPRSRVA